MKKRSKIALILIIAAIVVVSALLYAAHDAGGPAPTPTPTPTPPGGQPIPNARIKSISFDKDEYYAGDTVVAMLEVENTGSTNITSERVVIRATCTRLDDPVANFALKFKSEEERTTTYPMEFSELIELGQTETLSAAFNIPAEVEVSGTRISLAGDYDVGVTLSVDGIIVDAKELTLTLH
ncbi:MAG: hypothetical protein QMC78_06210 [Methanocellales archaeon]|nr:hypothetical protein [Methanocellales archaeon]